MYLLEVCLLGGSAPLTLSKLGTGIYKQTMTTPTWNNNSTVSLCCQAPESSTPLPRDLSTGMQMQKNPGLHRVMNQKKMITDLGLQN